MASLTLTYSVLVCDGCGVKFGESREYDKAADARRAALTIGWKIVPKVTPNGKVCRVSDNLGRIGKTANDACPDCAPTLEPRELIAGNTGGEAWYTDRIRRLEAEIEKLRGSR